MTGALDNLLFVWKEGGIAQASDQSSVPNQLEFKKTNKITPPIKNYSPPRLTTDLTKPPAWMLPTDPLPPDPASGNQPRSNAAQRPGTASALDPAHQDHAMDVAMTDESNYETSSEEGSYSSDNNPTRSEEDSNSSDNDPTRSEEGSYSSDNNLRTDEPPYSKVRQRRKVYGGGRLDWGGELEIWEVGLGVASNILSPAPLFIPHAFLLLGLPIGLPVLFLIGFLAWFSQVVLVVCGRYVGGRTYAQVASAVLPDRLKGCNIWFGETLVELCRVFVAGGRGMVNMMMVSDLFSQLTRQYTPKAAILYSRVFIIAFVGLLSLIPNFLRPRRPIFLPNLFPTLSRLPLLMTILWPISIGIIGFRLRQLNRELGRKLPPTREGDVYSEIMGGTVWGGFSILLFCLTTPQHTFKHLRSLKRINKPPGNNTTHHMKPLVSHPAEDGTSTTAVGDPLLASSSRSSIFSSYTIRRYSWESAALLGVSYSTLICLSWGLVGYLGMEHGGYEVNFLASLPSNDPWISSSRVLLLVVLIPSIPLSLRPATTALFHLLRIPGVIHTASSRRKKLRRRGGKTGRSMGTEWDDEDEDEPLVGSKVWMARLVTIAIWIAVSVGAIRLGGSNGGEGSTIEILGCVGSTIIAGLIPSTFWIVLFHIRKARPILNIQPHNSSRPSSRTSLLSGADNSIHRPGARSRNSANNPNSPQHLYHQPQEQQQQHRSDPDQLLAIKEAQLQKRLSGRRIWQDIGIFGLLIPFCVVVLLKGLIAVFHETGPPPLLTHTATTITAT
ncbi:hypothetical protein Pst134EA_002964 [Puccinia striiformis f. sp. tritici]|nr:hypothetical protein Pst134EA_002964 [Puccinia striiformis f. sp. tritici]KAH9472342.1 hypothetical protein Pst134EA_002964 [Puccinia striiformis f. sp. tritici]